MGCCETHRQTVLHYQDPQLCGGRLFFQAFPIELTTLKYHVLQGRIALYIGKTGTQEYVFDLEELEA
jgi:hypothetical protein